jgi:hypothetical protein
LLAAPNDQDERHDDRRCGGDEKSHYAVATALASLRFLDEALSVD